jgi:hypothetical protein
MVIRLLLRDPHRPSTADTGATSWSSGIAWRARVTPHVHMVKICSNQRRNQRWANIRGLLWEEGRGREVRPREGGTSGRGKVVVGSGRLGFRVQSLSEEENTERWEREDVGRSMLLGSEAMAGRGRGVERLGREATTKPWDCGRKRDLEASRRRTDASRLKMREMFLSHWIAIRWMQEKRTTWTS